jgi:hypothetical protein
MGVTHSSTDAGHRRCGAGAPQRATAARAYAEVPAPVGVALRAMRLEALLGDPRDPANPYGFAALAGGAADAGRLSAAAAPGDGAPQDLEQLARVLRPVFRRDLDLGLQCVRRALPARGGAAAGARRLLGAAALTGSTAAVLRTAAGTVAERALHERGARQWHTVLAEAFADLLACQALTAVALRCAGPGARGHRAVSGAVAHAVPAVLAEVLAELDLVLTESGSGAGAAERRMLDRAVGAVRAAGARAAQAGPGGPEAVLPGPATAAPQPAGPGGQALFRLGTALVAPAGQDGADDVLSATLAGGAAPLTTEAAGAGAALRRVARRLAAEQRVLRRACRDVDPHDVRAPAVRALADRQALLLMSAAVLGVQQAAGSSLADPHWALLALSRALARLGVPQPGTGADPRGQVWAQLAGRRRHSVDCDVYGTRVLW